MESEQGESPLPSVTPQESNMNENNDVDNDSGVEISCGSRKRGRISKGWNYFKRIKIGNMQHAQCIYCQSRLIATTRAGTSHLWNHYRSTCKKCPNIDNCQRSKKPTPSQEVAKCSFNQDDSRHELASMVILHDYPLSIVGHIGFKRFVSSLQPLFDMISRNTLKSDIVKIYEIERSKCYKLLDKLQSRIAITTDMWTSNNTKKGFMEITGHYIDDSWNLQHCILRFVYVPAPHTALVLSDVAVESLMDWNVDRKLSSNTVDNCTTNDCIMNLLLDSRYKLKLVEFYFPRIYGERSHSKVNEVRQSCQDLLAEYQSRALSSKEGNSLVNAENTCLSDFVDLADSDTLELFDKFVASSSNLASSISQVTELDIYLEESVLPRTQNFDILSWWKTNGVKYPFLQKMARDVLAIPVSTVASESAFSSSGKIISPHRSRLHPSTLEALMCTRRWLWNDTKGICSTIAGTPICPTMLDEEVDEEDCAIETLSG